MTFLQLRYFQALAYNLHYTKTAAELHISQPSLSYAIKELEKELGVELFRREKHKLALTENGKVFLPYVEKSLQLLADGRSKLSVSASDAERIVRIGYFHSISASFIPSMVEEFYKAGNSGIHFQFTEAPSFDIFQLLQNGELDIAFCMHRDTWAKAFPVMQQTMLLAVSPLNPLAARTEVSFLDFAREPQIMLDHSANLRSMMDALFASQDIEPDIIFEVRECNAALQYVSMNFGVSVLPRVPAMDSEKITVLPITDHIEELTRNVYCVYDKRGTMPPAVKTVLDFVKERYRLNRSAGQ